MREPARGGRARYQVEPRRARRQGGDDWSTGRGGIEGSKSRGWDSSCQYRAGPGPLKPQMLWPAHKPGQPEPLTSPLGQMWVHSQAQLKLELHGGN